MTATMADQAILDGEPAAGGLAPADGAPEDWASQELGTGAARPRGRASPLVGASPCCASACS